MNTIEFFQNLEQSLQKRLRDYQLEGIQEIDNYLDQGVKSILRQNFTGTGKSVEQNYLAIRHLAQSENNTVLLLAHREELIENLAEYFNENKVYLSFVKSGLATLFNTRVYIASVDTLKNRLEKLPIQPTLIMADECHHSPAKSWKKILDYYPDAIKLGFSATPERLDGKSFTDLYQGLVTGKPYQWYIDNHYLAPFQFVNPGHFVSFDFKKTRGDFDLQQQEEILNNDVINADAVDTWYKFTPGLKTVVFCSSVEHSKQVTNAYNNFGMSEYGKEIAAHLDGTTDKNYRREVLKRFKLPTSDPNCLLILSNFQLFVEGVNIADASVTQWLRKTASEIIYDQGNGRSNRYQPGKVQYIIDHVGNKLIHGYPNRIRTYDLKGRKEREQEAKYHLICPACKTVVHTDYRRLQNAAETVDCPECGCTIPVPKPKKRSPRKEKEIDLNIEMVLDACQDTYSVNMQALFRRYNHLNTKRYFESLLKHDHLTLEDFKAACVYRNLSENHAYATWSKKLQRVLSAR